MYENNIKRQKLIFKKDQFLVNDVILGDKTQSLGPFQTKCSTIDILSAVARRSCRNHCSQIKNNAVNGR